MPEMSGVEAIRAIRKDYPSSRFIVLTTYQGDQDIERALSAGAQEYLLKGMPGDELVSSIRSVHAGLRVLPPPVLRTLAERPASSDLSAREMDILQLIVKGLSNRQIGDTLGITEGTVKWHVNLILRVGAKTRSQLRGYGVVPFRQKFMRFDSKSVHLRGSRLGARGIVSAVEVSGDGKAGLSASGADEVEDFLIGGERFAGPVFGDFGEETMFDGVPLGSA